MDTGTCIVSSDGVHCSCYYDGDLCCCCGSPSPDDDWFDYDDDDDDN